MLESPAMTNTDDCQLSDLESQCDDCGGRAGSWEGRQWEPCGSCDGRGYLPTPLGEQILRLMRHNLRILDAAKDRG